eukprot:7779858-Alexandrium_andersonii.AAC.1
MDEGVSTMQSSSSPDHGSAEHCSGAGKPELVRCMHDDDGVLNEAICRPCRGECTLKVVSWNCRSLDASQHRFA